MKEIKVLTFNELATMYCERQEQTPEGLRTLLLEKIIQFQPIGFLLLQCADLGSRLIGQYTILPYGPNNSLKEIPDRPVSPRGLSSDMSVVVGVIPASGVK